MAKRMTKVEYKAAKNEEKAALEMKLDVFLGEALTSKVRMAELTAHYRISGLYGYSLYNSILIHMQGGKLCQSFNKWKKLGRIVTKGQKSSVSVFIPMISKKTLADGTEESKLFGFKLGPVFDMSQTEGDALEYDHNSVDTVKDFPAIKSAMEELTGVAVIEEFTGSARGWSNGKEMAVSSMSNDTDKTSTLIHEVAHHMLHTGPKQEGKVSREAAEIEAESVSYLVASYLGIDKELSTGYVAGFKSGASEIRTKKIIGAADKIIKAIRD